MKCRTNCQVFYFWGEVDEGGVKVIERCSCVAASGREEMQYRQRLKVEIIFNKFHGTEPRDGGQIMSTFRAPCHQSKEYVVKLLHLLGILRLVSLKLKTLLIIGDFEYQFAIAVPIFQVVARRFGIGAKQLHGSLHEFIP